MTEGLPDNSAHKREFEAMRLATERPELAGEIAQGLNEGLPVENGIARKVETPLPPKAKKKSWITKWEEEH